MTKRAIILAAGKGTRMTSYASASPKPLLEFNGEALLTRQLQSFTDAGVTEFIIVGGYLFDRMRDYAADSRHNITLLYNPFFAVSNSIGSLWFAKEYLDESVFITNGDTFFEKSIFSQLESNLNNYVFGIDKSKKLDADYINDRALAINRSLDITPGVGDIGRVEYRVPLKLDVSRERNTYSAVEAVDNNPLMQSLRKNAEIDEAAIKEYRQFLSAQ